MSLIVGALRAVFGADTAAFEKGVDQVDRKLKSSQRAFQAFGKKVQGVGKSLSLFVSTPLAAIGASSIKTAMEMEELQNAFDVTFKSGSESMRKWAEETGDILGRSTKEMQESSVAFASLFNKALDPQQANELTKQFSVLTQDLASFKDLSNEVAQQKLFSGLTGEAEPLKSVGVFINAAATEAKAFELGLEKVNGKFTDQQKIVARAALIQEQLAEASGDVVRSQGSATNQLKAAQAAFEELRVVIGTKLLPVITPLITKTAEALNWFTGLNEGLQNSILIAAGVVAALGPVLTVIGTLSTVLAPLGAALAVATGATTGLGAAMTVALGPIGLVIAALGTLTLAYKTLSPVLRDNKKARDELYGTIDKNKSILAQDQATTIAGARAQIAAAKATREHLQAQLELQEATLKKQVKGFVAINTNPLGRAAGTLGLNKKMAANIAKTSMAMRDAREAIKANEAAALDLEANLAKLGGTLDGTASSTTKLTEAQIAAKKAKAKAEKEALKASEKARGAHRDMIAETKEEIETNAALAEALKISQREYDIIEAKIEAVKDGFIGTDEAARAHAITLLESRDALEAVKTATEEQAEALEASKQKAIDLAEKMREAAAQRVEDHNNVTKSVEQEIIENEKLAAALQISRREYEITVEMLRLVENGYTGTEEAARKLAERVVMSREKLDEVDEAAKKVEKTLKKTGKTGVDAFTNTLNSFTDLLGALKSGDIEGIIGGILGALQGLAGGGGSSGGGVSGLFSSIGKIFGGFRAEGGPVDPNKTYIVGENGSEWFSPGTSGSIIPNNNIGGMVTVMVEEGALFRPVIKQEAAGVAAPIAEVTTVRGVSQYSDQKNKQQSRRLA